jgi:hypothetical protein
MRRMLGSQLLVAGITCATVLQGCSEANGIDRIPVVQFAGDSVAVMLGDSVGVHLLPMLPPGYVPTVTWSSSSPGIATVSPQTWSTAVVRGVAVGEAVISASGEGAADSVIVTVRQGAD